MRPLPYRLEAPEAGGQPFAVFVTDINKFKTHAMGMVCAGDSVASDFDRR